MASRWSWTVLFIFMFMESIVAYQFIVGGSKGWTVPAEMESYNKWAGMVRFQIGDTLLFKYDKEEDSVLQVTKQGYNTCNSSSPIASFKNGNTVFKLPVNGPFYFISGNSSNCQKGEKLVVVVLAPCHWVRGENCGKNGSHSPSPSPSQNRNPSPGPAPILSSPSAAPASTPGSSVSPSSTPSPSPSAAPASSPGSSVSPSSTPSPSPSAAPASSPGASVSPSSAPTPSPSPSAVPTPGSATSPAPASSGTTVPPVSPSESPLSSPPPPPPSSSESPQTSMAPSPPSSTTTSSSAAARSLILALLFAAFLRG